MRRFSRALLFLLVAAWVAPVCAAPDILPFEDVSPGMRGTGKTVFEGSRIETFDVEILGKLPNIGPGRNLILARLSGGPLAETGVLAGMSGSPVSIDGKLIGAVAFGWGFATEPIAGITPIEEMLAVANAEGGGAGRTASVLPSTDLLDRLYAPDGVRSFLVDLQTRLVPVGTLPVTVPLSVAGMDAGALIRMLPGLAGAGFLPVQAGGPGSGDEPVEPLQPGSAMGMKLVRGDVDITATGTVTWVEGDRVLAFGHPLFGLGSVDLPLTGARVEALLPSLQQSSRMARPLGEVGAVRQDRAAGVLGLVGVRPRMIPVRLQLEGPAGDERTFRFDIADDPLLSPLLLYASLNGILAGQTRVFGNATVRLKRGSVIQMVGNDDIALDNLFVGASAFDHGTGIAAYVVYLLMNNPWTRPDIVAINLMLEYRDVPATARIRRVAVDRFKVTPGETVRVDVVLSPYRGRDRHLTREILIPAETPPGPITFTIGGAMAVSRDVDSDRPVLPRDLGQLIWLINQLRRNDQIYILASREDSGVLLGGVRLPNLPPSVATVLTRPRSSGNYTYIPRRGILEEVIPTEYAIEGSARIHLEVERR